MAPVVHSVQLTLLLPMPVRSPWLPLRLGGPSSPGFQLLLLLLHGLCCIVPLRLLVGRSGRSHWQHRAQLQLAA